MHSLVPGISRRQRNADGGRRSVTDSFELSAIDRRACRRSRGAAIDENLGAIDVRRVVGGEEQDRLGHFLGFAEPSQRNAARDVLVQHREGFGGRRRAIPDRRFRRPGATTLTLIPRGASSDAITRAMPRTPALLAA